MTLRIQRCLGRTPGGEIYLADRDGVQVWAQRLDPDVDAHTLLDYTADWRDLNKECLVPARVATVADESALIYVAGRAVQWSQVIARGPLPHKVALEMAARVADRLAQIETPHGHLCPQVLWLTPDTTVLVSGFELGAIEDTEADMHAWLPPEQLMGESVHESGACWFVGALLAAMLQGEPLRGPAGPALVDLSTLPPEIWDDGDLVGFMADLLHDEPDQRSKLSGVAAQARALAKTRDGDDLQRWWSGFDTTELPVVEGGWSYLAHPPAVAAIERHTALPLVPQNDLDEHLDLVPEDLWMVSSVLRVVGIFATGFAAGMLFSAWFLADSLGPQPVVPVALADVVQAAPVAAPEVEPEVAAAPVEEPEAVSGPQPASASASTPSPTVAGVSPKPAPKAAPTAFSVPAGKAAVEVSSSRRALVYVNGKAVDYTPIRLLLPPGKVEVGVGLPGQLAPEKVRSVKLREGQVRALSFTL